MHGRERRVPLERLGDGEGRLDFDIPDSGQDKDEITAELMRRISQNADVTYRWIADEELEAVARRDHAAARGDAEGPRLDGRRDRFTEPDQDVAIVITEHGRLASNQPQVPWERLLRPQCAV